MSGRKEKACAELGIFSETHVLPEATGEADLLALIAKLNADSRLHGILVQAPLPKQIREAKIYSAVSAAEGRGRFSSGERRQADAGRPDGFPALHAGGHHGIARAFGREDRRRGSRGARPRQHRGQTDGRDALPEGQNANATVTICHSATRDIQAHCRRADILIAAMGVAEFVKADMVKPGAVVIDVGVNRVPDATVKTGSRLVGDVDFAGVQPIAGKITPNPGGVGPMTIAMLMQNTVRAAEMLPRLI